MLPDETKQILADWVAFAKRDHGRMVVLRRTSPERLIKIMLDNRHLGRTKGSHTLTAAFYYDLEQNRAEAEQYLAELIGDQHGAKPDQT